MTQGGHLLERESAAFRASAPVRFAVHAPALPCRRRSSHPGRRSGLIMFGRRAETTIDILPVVHHPDIACWVDGEIGLHLQSTAHVTTGRRNLVTGLEAGRTVLGRTPHNSTIESVFSWERAISDHDVVADRLLGSSGLSKMRTIRGRSRGMSLSLQARWGIS